MRLIKQTTLYFKEGNSDKVYEIDLCDVGNDRYVVNFRYGRRGASLKEGSKTPVPVALQEAERLFSEVADEKISKGYTATESSAPVTPRGSSFSLSLPALPAFDVNTLTDVRARAILKRLQDAIQGSAGSRRSKWKLSRVIWKAGQYKIQEAAPFIIQLFSKGDTLHQYAGTWALIRSGHEMAVPAVQSIHTDHPTPIIRKLAGAGLFQLLRDTALEQHTARYVKDLPESLREALAAQQGNGLASLLLEHTGQQPACFSHLETIYLLSVEKRWLRPVLKNVLLQAPLRPHYFKEIRAVYKLAELFDDFEFTGLLGCQLERQPEMFKHRLSLKDQNTKALFPGLDTTVNPHKELRKKDSRLAYSQRTRWYLHRRIRRRLELLGNAGDVDYVKLATALLIGYNRQKDHKDAYATSKYVYNGRQYVLVETRFPQNAQAVFLHYILSGEHPDLELVGGHTWRIRSAADRRASSAGASSSGQGNSGGLLKKIIGIFGKKKQDYRPMAGPTPAPAAHEIKSQPNKNGTPYLHLWNQLPQSYVQLLIEAGMEEIHEFAASGLTTHSDYPQLKQKLDKEVYKKLLVSPYPVPARLGYTLATERYAGIQPDSDLVSAMLQSSLTEAHNKGMEWGNTYQYAYAQQTDFIASLIFLREAATRNWAQAFLNNNHINADIRQAAIGKAIATIIGIDSMQHDTEAYVAGAKESLFAWFAPEIQQVPLAVIADLLLHPVPPVLLLGLQLLKANQQHINADSLNHSLVAGLLQHPYAPVREAGIELVNVLDPAALMKFHEQVLAACISEYGNVRQHIAPLVGRMAKYDRTFGDEAATLLMPYLMRKEQYEGLHEDVGRLLCNELSDHLQHANKETALNLLYGNYTAAQNVGVVILEKYTQPDQLTLPQVIALGGHENITVRQWCWRFYEQQPARIRFEKEVAVKLLESKWDDSRAFAMKYFRDLFTEADWTPEALITLADSVKPDVEAYGRELITRFFNSDHGHQYLISLSQHPSEKMQLFATNYLERFAADDVHRIASLEFYFRSVLTRVNKSRVAKNRIYYFLLTEGRKSEEAAKIVSGILSDISATAAIGDKAKCIEVLLQLKALYEVETPLKIKPIETRMSSTTLNPLS